MSNVLLEVCVDSYASAMAAVHGGASRLELCSALALGGLTPWAGLLAQIRQKTDIPIRCLMRPRPGDFLYSEEELELLCAQIIHLHRRGASGFVFGCLNAHGDLDTRAMKRLIGATGGAPFTLHRAVDVCRDALATYDEAKALGADAVLTSGQAACCVDGGEVLGTLLARHGETGGPEVLIASGVNAEAIRTLRLQFPTARAFHMSGKHPVESGMAFRREGIPMGVPGLDEWQHQITDETAVRQAKEMLETPISKL